MECGEELSREPSPQTRSSCRAETSRSLFCRRRRRKDRGAEQGDDYGPPAWPWEWLHVAGHQAAGIVPWVGAHSVENVQRVHGEHRSRMHLLKNFRLGSPEKLTGANDPRHALQEHGGLADFWYLDDCDILCHPVLVLPFLQAFDTTDPETGCRKKSTKDRSHLLHLRSGRCSLSLEDQ